MLFLRGCAVWLLIICAEFVHGILRTLFLQPLIGDFRARQISVFTGILMIFVITYFLIRWMKARKTAELIGIGVMWLILTVCFEIGLGRLLGFSWERILEDYKIHEGGLMIIGLLAMTLSPFLAAKMRGIQNNT